MIKKLHITLPLPNMKLSPNQKNGTNWQSTNKVKNIDINMGYVCTLKALASDTNKYKLLFTLGDKLHTKMNFYLPDKRKRDYTNMISAYKHMEDGIFKALQCDDSQIVSGDWSKHYDKINSRLELTITYVGSKINGKKKG